MHATKVRDVHGRVREAIQPMTGESLMFGDTAKSDVGIDAKFSNDLRTLGNLHRRRRQI